MSFDWKLYITLADELLNFHRTTALEQAYLRSSISRSYYGVFCAARDRKGLQDFRGSKAHFKVITMYKNSASLLERQAGWILDELRRYRNRADYSTDTNVGRDLASRALIKAQQVLNNLSSL